MGTVPPRETNAADRVRLAATVQIKGLAALVGCGVAAVSLLFAVGVAILFLIGFIFYDGGFRTSPVLPPGGEDPGTQAPETREPSPGTGTVAPGAAARQPSSTTAGRKEGGSRIKSTTT